jgi:hypothetical protein
MRGSDSQLLATEQRHDITTTWCGSTLNDMHVPSLTPTDEKEKKKNAPLL